LSKLALRRESPFVLGALAGTVGMSPCVVGTFLTAVSAIGKSGQTIVWAYYALIYATTPVLIAWALHSGKKIDPTKFIVALATFSLFVSVYMTLVNFGILSLPSL
jgi:cytochrome c biogenesis protein CcdA